MQVDQRFTVVDGEDCRVYFEHALQANNFNTSNGLIPAMLKVVEYVLGGMVRPEHACTVSEAKMQNLMQTKSVAKTIVQ